MEIRLIRIKLTEIKNVYVKDVTCGTSKQAISLVGDPRLPPKGLHLENVVVGKVTKSFSRIENVEDVTFDNVKLK